MSILSLLFKICSIRFWHCCDSVVFCFKLLLSSAKEGMYPIVVKVWELLTLPEHLSSSPVFSGVPATRSFVFHVVLCVPFFLFSYCFIWPLCCLFFFFDIRILIAPLISSNSSLQGYNYRILNIYKQ